MSLAKSVPQDVFWYLSEGNSKEDLIEWLWDLLTDEQKADIEKEAKNILEESNA